MEYGLARLVLGSRALVPITEGSYSELEVARTGLLEALFLEEKFDLVIENFLELETELLSSAARYMVHGETNFGWFQIERNLINRRLVNLLSVCRGYLDFVRPLGQQLLANEPERASEFDQSFGRHYDGTFGYRVMEAMRNFVQHRGFPIHALQYNSKLDENQARNRFSFAVSVFTKTTYLRRDGGFKSSVLAELEALGGRVDVKPLFRDYVACLAESHEGVRAIQKAAIEAWEKKFLDAVRQFQTAFPAEPSILGLAAIKIDGPNRTDEIPLHPGFIERRKELQSKNRGYGNLAKRFVTGRVMDPNA